MTEPGTHDSEINDIRLAVMRVIAELQDHSKGPVRAIHIYHHASLQGEKGKRIANTLFTCKNAAKPLILTNVSNDIEVTAQGRDYLQEHVTDVITDIPVFGGRRTQRQPARPGPQAPPRAPIERMRFGRELQENKPLAPRPTQLPPPPPPPP